MSTHLQLRVDKIKRYFTHLGDLRTRASQAVEGLEVLEVMDPAGAIYGAPPDVCAASGGGGGGAAWRALSVGGDWGGKQVWGWFRAKGTVPADWPVGDAELRIDVGVNYLGFANQDYQPAGPEGQVFIDGRHVGAVDRQHNLIRFPFVPGRTYDLRAVIFAARCDCRHKLTALGLARVDRATEKLWHDWRVLLDMAGQLPEDAIAREKILRALEASLGRLNLRDKTFATFPPELKRDPGNEMFYPSVAAAQAALDEALTELRGSPEIAAIVAVGHAHIDLAWLWPVKHTHHKCVATFATQCRMLEEYPDWIYQQSSPQAYAWVEEDAPEVFGKIKDFVAAGRWEADGATWVEMDTNISGGESLVRQLLYGKTYFKEKFGVDSRMLWLPDVFGYSAALPQLLRLAGVEGFVTSKISWSQFNRFPHDTFRWRGLDGSEVTTHFITTRQGDLPFYTYNAVLDVKEVVDCWREYRQKDRLLEPLMSYGWGDGGGGPTTIMHETARRVSAWAPKAGLPTVRHEKAGALLKRIAARAGELPVWDGELYLEYHRGTYTTQAWLKRAHRQGEIALHNVEWLAALAQPHGYKLDKPALDALWKELLFLEFHDILPGSSIGEVYDDARVSLRRILEQSAAMTAQAAGTIAGRIRVGPATKPVVLFNTLSWDRADPMRLPDGRWLDGVTVPAGGYRVIDAANPPAPGVPSAAPTSGGYFPPTVSEDGRMLENQYWRLRLDEQGRMVELLDKAQGRLVFEPGRLGNQWQVFEDRPLQYGAWDIDHYYQQHPVAGLTCQGIRVAERSPARVAVELTWAMPMIGKGPRSTITQRLVLWAATRRIDFETTADWYDHHTLLKIAFATGLRATEATYQIQFGHLQRPTHRNTSWDFAKFEVSAHRFIDLSEHGYGVALLNDCKYGFDVHEDLMRMTCIKSPQEPNTTADRGRHEFTYALLPHAGTFQEAGVIRAAAELNVPVLTQEAAAASGGGGVSGGGGGGGTLAEAWSFIKIDSPAVVLDTLKPAEDKCGLILRLYESFGSHAKAKLTFAQRPKSVAVNDLLEQPRENDLKLQFAGDTASLALRPFQVATLRVEF